MKTIIQRLKDLPGLKPVMRYGGAVLGIAILAVMLVMLWQIREDLLQVLARVNFGWLLVALAINLAMTLLYCTIWYFTQLSLAPQPSCTSYRAMLTVVSLSSAGRYLPGGVWAALGLVGLSSKVGMTMLSIPVLFGLAQGVHLLLAWCISVNGLAWFTFSGQILDGWRSGLVSLLSVGLVFGAITSYRRYFQPLIRHLPDFHPKLRLNRQWLGRATLSSMVVWLLCGLRLGVILLACQSSLPPTDPVWLGLFLIWTAAVSGIAISLFFFIPLGLGAVELGLTAFLGLLTNNWPLIVAVLLLNRVVQIVNDFIVVGYSLYYLKKIEPEPES